MRFKTIQLVRFSALFVFIFMSVWILNPTRDGVKPVEREEDDDSSSGHPLGQFAGQLESFPHSNQTLESFRRNMTLSQVNMTGLVDIIRRVNRSQVDPHVRHDSKQHKNVPNPHDFKYLINSDNLCFKRDIFLFVYVHSAPGNFKKRLMIRNTWGNSKYYPGVIIRVMFFMGKHSAEPKVQESLKFENEQYHDIVQEDFEDSYRNLTYKGIGALKWISGYCSNAKFILKTDDDIFVNMFTLLKHLKSMQSSGKEARSTILCLVWNRMKVMREGKWKVAKEEWSEDYYPTYCSGSAFVLTTDVAVRLHEVSYHVPFFWVDDFYITGLLPMKAGNITHKQFMSTYVLHGKNELQDKFTGPNWFTYVYSHVHDLDLIQSVWDQLVKLARGEIAPKVAYALPGNLPDEQEVARKAEEKRKKLEEEKKKKAEAKKKEASKT